MYIYPDNLAAKATLWLWELKDLAIIVISFFIGIFSLNTKTHNSIRYRQWQANRVGN